MELQGVHHVSLNVSDAEESEHFYVDVLGLTKLPRPDFDFPGSWLELADGRQVHLIQVEGWTAPKGQHFALRVDDLDGTRRELADQGVKVSEPSTIPGAGRQCFFRDPAGNMIELNEPRTAAAAG